MTLHASTPGRPSSLGILLAQIEGAWTRDRDADLPIQLAEEHPEHADDLLDFFDDLVLSSIAPPVSEEDRADVARRLSDDLRRTGRSALADAVDRSLSLQDGPVDDADSGTDPSEGGRYPLRLVSIAERSGPALEEQAVSPANASTYPTYYEYAKVYDHRLPQIAEAFGLPVGTAHILVADSDRCPPRAQREMARRGAENLYGVEYQLGLDVLTGHGKTPEYALPKAASRSSAYEKASGFSYEQTIRNAPSSFPDEERAFWLSLIGDDRLAR